MVGRSYDKYSLKGLFERVPMRVEWRQGQNNLLLVSPHGHKLDDTHTDIVTKVMADELKCSYVLNYGWKRDKDYNPELGRANCNDTEHVKMNEATEFLNPIIDISDSLIKQHGIAQVLFIHGMGNGIRNTAPNVDAVIGYGAGKKEARFTCDLWRKDLLIDLMTDCGWCCYEGAPGGKFSAYSKTNLTQAISRREKIQGIQIEIIGNRRTNEYVAEQTGKSLAAAVKEFMNVTNSLADSYKEFVYRRKYSAGQV